jgi:ribosomal protein L37AE/L43A
MSLSVGLDRMEPVLILKELSGGEDKVQVEPRPGDVCPECKEGTLDYDGMLNLSCDRCGYSIAGCFT